MCRQGNKRVGVISATFEVYLRFKHHLSFSIMIVFYQSLFYIIVFYYFIIVSCFYLSLASWLLFSNRVKLSSVQLYASSNGVILESLDFDLDGTHHGDDFYSETDTRTVS